MRKLFFILALAMPMSLLAEEAADTTIVYNVVPQLRHQHR